jgi:hypothetical protein
MPINELAGKIAEYLPNNRGGGAVAAGAVLGSVLSRR